MYDIWLTTTPLQVLLAGEHCTTPEWIHEAFGITYDELTVAGKWQRFHATWLSKEQVKEIVALLLKCHDMLYGERFEGSYTGMIRYDNSAYSMPVNEAANCWRAAERLEKQIRR